MHAVNECVIIYEVYFVLLTTEHEFNYSFVHGYMNTNFLISQDVFHGNWVTIYPSLQLQEILN
jgi:hypothetical protein